jgi:2-oxoglutarate ferredoxin oxidoreductase subunit delta
LSTKLKKQPQIHLIENRCKGCGFCIEFCPQKILLQSKETNAKGYPLVSVTDIEKCSGCGMCSRVCPEFAIYVETEKGKE